MKTKYQDKSAAPAPVVSSAPKAAPSRAAAAPKLGPPKFSLEGNKWVIVRVPPSTLFLEKKFHSYEVQELIGHFILPLKENQVGNKNIVIEDPEVRQTVYIYKCQDSVVQIKGKVNAITIGKAPNQLAHLIQLLLIAKPPKPLC